MKSTRRVLVHLLLCSLFHSHLAHLPRSALLALLAHSAALIRSLACSITRFKARGKEVHVYQLNASISYSFHPQYRFFRCDEAPL